MTWYSIDSRLMRPSRPSSRSTSLRASSGSSRASELRAQLVDLLALVLLAELAADRLELLAQEDLALAVADLLLHLALDVLLRVEHVDLALHVDQHAAQPLLDRQRLEQALALGVGQLEIAGDQIGQPARLVHLLQHLLHDLLGKAGLLAELAGARAQLAQQRQKGRVLGVDGLELLDLAHHRLEMILRRAVAHGDAALDAVQQHLHAAGDPLQLADPGDRADGEQDLRP